jgi:hypothetical protein
VRASVNDRPDVLAAQRSSKSARNESVHDLHSLNVARVRYDLEECRIEWERTLELCGVRQRNCAPFPSGPWGYRDLAIPSMSPDPAPGHAFLEEKEPQRWVRCGLGCYLYVALN